MDQANPAEYSPRPRFSIQPLVVIAIGTVLVFIGALVLYHFANNPVGLLPGIAGWKGGPMLLCAGFCCSLGALLIVRRRFSLGIFVIGAVLSSLLSAGATAYMHSMRQNYLRNFEVRVKAEELAGISERMRTNVSAARIHAFVEKLVENHYSDGPDYENLQIFIGAKPGTEDVIAVTVAFESNPYLHPDTTNIRNWIVRYTHFLALWEEDRQNKEKMRDMGRWLGILGGVDFYPRITLLREGFFSMIAALNTAENERRYRNALETKTALNTTTSAMPGLEKFLEIETDPEIKEFAQQLKLGYADWLHEHPPYLNVNLSTTAAGLPMRPVRRAWSGPSSSGVSSGQYSTGVGYPLPGRSPQGSSGTSSSSSGGGGLGGSSTSSSGGTPVKKPIEKFTDE